MNFKNVSKIINKILTIPLICSFLISSQVIMAEEVEEQGSDAKKGFLDSLLGSNYSFSNVSYNYLDWTKNTTKATGKADFAYLELEGGAGWDWGDVYFFMDIENPTRSWDGDNAPDNRRFVIKPKINFKLLDSNWLFHVQNYYLKEDDFYVNNFVPSIAYNFFSGGLWVQPFIGGHYQNSDATYFDTYTGWNGYMAGWVFNYDFTLKGQKFALSQWHENEFKRDKDHYKADDGTNVGDGANHGYNGAIAVWWHFNKHITTGLQYRYAKNKLGAAPYQTGPIYTVKYNF